MHKPIINFFKKTTVYSGFEENIIDMQSISKFSKGLRFLLCVIDIFSKYAWVVTLKDKQGIIMVDVFKKY